MRLKFPALASVQTILDLLVYRIVGCRDYCTFSGMKCFLNSNFTRKYIFFEVLKKYTVSNEHLRDMTTVLPV